MTIWQLFETEMLKHKYIHSILKQNKFNTINIFGFDIVWCSFIEENVAFSKFFVPFLPAGSCRKNKIRTNEPEIHQRTVSLSQNYLVLTKKSVVSLAVPLNRYLQWESVIQQCIPWFQEEKKTWKNRRWSSFSVNLQISGLQLY